MLPAAASQNAFAFSFGSLRSPNRHFTKCRLTSKLVDLHFVKRRLGSALSAHYTLYDRGKKGIGENSRLFHKISKIMFSVTTTGTVIVKTVLLL